MKKYVLALAVGAALIVAPFAGSTDSQKAVTVGDFAVKVSRALGFAATDRSAAVESLRAVGVNLETSLDARLTEGLAADILGSLGMRVSTSNPEGAINSARADSLATTLALAGLHGLSTEAFPPPPTQCLQFKKGKCKECCKRAIGNKQDPDLRGKNLDRTCKRFCKTGEFPSPSEPGE